MDSNFQYASTVRWHRATDLPLPSTVKRRSAGHRLPWRDLVPRWRAAEFLARSRSCDRIPPLVRRLYSDDAERRARGEMALNGGSRRPWRRRLKVAIEHPGAAEFAQAQRVEIVPVGMGVEAALVDFADRLSGQFRPGCKMVGLEEFLGAAEPGRAPQIALRSAISVSLWRSQNAIYLGSGYSKSAGDVRNLHSCPERRANEICCSFGNLLGPPVLVIADGRRVAL